MSDFEDLIDVVRRQAGEIEALRTQIASIVQVGKVVESEHGKGVRVRLPGGTDEKPNLSPWLANADASGVTSYRAKVGEQVRIISPNGDIEQGSVEPFDHTDEKKNPAPDGDTSVLWNRDDVNISIKNGVLTFTAKTKFAVVVNGKSYTFDGKEHKFEGDKAKFETDKVAHGDKNIGKDHVHPGVQKGAAKTDPPDA